LFGLFKPERFVFIDLRLLVAERSHRTAMRKHIHFSTPQPEKCRTFMQSLCRIYYGALLTAGNSQVLSLAPVLP
jgi:hypothetical protein